MNKEPTNKDILDAISAFSSNFHTRIDGLQTDIKGAKPKVGSLMSDIEYIKSNMVTRDFLDTKMSNLRGDLAVLTSQENNK